MDLSPLNGTYLYPVVTSPTVARQRFAAFTRRVLEDARARGMSDTDIATATGIGTSTFHRWQSGAGGLPQIDKVARFVDGLDVPLEAALRALGVEDKPSPAPVLSDDPDITRVARKLRDPNVPEEEKQAIRYMLRQVAGRKSA